MNTQNRLLLLFLSLMTGFFSYGQTVDEVIDRHIQAIGGKEKLAAINSVLLDNTMQLMGNESQGKVTILNGRGYRIEFDYTGSAVVQVYTDKNGWEQTPMTGSAPQALPDEMYKNGEETVYIFPLLNFAEHGAKAELLGQEDVGTVKAYKIKITNKEGKTSIYYIDTTNYYLIQTIRSSEFMGSTIDLITSYSDFKTEENGIVLPHFTDTNFGAQFAMQATTKKVQFNVPVDNGIFEMK